MSKAADAFRTISEVADDLGIPKHVLRFWEAKFTHIRPMKRGGGRRYYRPEDMELLKGIRQLLHRDGYTIKGVQKILREQGVDAVKARMSPAGAVRAETTQSPATGASTAPKAVAEKPASRGRVKRELAGTSPAPALVAPNTPIAAAIAELEACHALLLAVTSGSTIPASVGGAERAAR